MKNLEPILLIEDSEVTQSVVVSILKDVCAVKVAATQAQALELLADVIPKLILLDINLPDGDGFELYLEIRRNDGLAATPILFLTGRQDQSDKLRGFSLGADDYIVKPFDLLEFKARISSKLKNLIRAREQLVETLALGPFTIDAALHKIHVDEKKGRRTLTLTGNQFRILLFLLQSHGKIVSREELLQRFWGHGVHVSNRTIDSHIYSIRQELGDLGKLLKSVHGKGYCFELTAGAQYSAA